jgi:hypothetical protein
MVSFSFEDLALYINGDLARQIAAGDRCRDVGGIAHLRGEVTGHLIDAFGEILPDAGNAPGLGLATELPLGSDLARDAGDFGSEHGELFNHPIHQFG